MNTLKQAQSTRQASSPTPAIKTIPTASLTPKKAFAMALEHNKASHLMARSVRRAMVSTNYDYEYSIRIHIQYVSALPRKRPRYPRDPSVHGCHS
jgi:hypothetical protein